MDLDLVIGPVAEFPKFEFSKREVRAAGESLKDTLPWSPETMEIFKIANSWCDSDAHPMRAIRYALNRTITASADRRTLLPRGSKRMPSIRKKACRLYQGQSELRLTTLAGCGGTSYRR